MASHFAPEAAPHLPKLARWAPLPWIPRQGFTLATRARQPQKERNKSSAGLFVRPPGPSKGFALASHQRSSAPLESRSLHALIATECRRRHAENIHAKGKMDSMRNRKNIVSIRMNDEEYDLLKAKVKEAGVTQQSFIINAIIGATIASADEVKVQKEISRSLSDLVHQLRGLATNVNQIAHIANGQGALPPLNELLRIHDEISNIRTESDEIWLSIRSSINSQRATGQ